MGFDLCGLKSEIFSWRPELTETTEKTHNVINVQWEQDVDSED